MAHNLQAICTRVSTGEECEIIIEDGVSVKKERKKRNAVEKAQNDVVGSDAAPESEEGADPAMEAQSESKSWKAGEF